MADRLLKGKRAVWMEASRLQCWRIVDWDSFSGAWVGWEVCAGLKLCRKSFWLWNSITFMRLHCYLKWKITSAGGMGMLLDLQLRPTDCQTYCCIWALKTPFGRPSLDCIFFWKIHTAYYFQENPKAFEDLPFSVLIASAFMEVHCTQKQNRAAI